MVAVRTACTLHDQPLRVPDIFTFGRHTITSEELALTPDDAEVAASILEHTLTYTLALQIGQAMKDVLRKPREHADTSVRAAFEIARLVRNAYAHQPFHPHWAIDVPCTNKTFIVPGITQLSTAGLSGQPLRWQHYGGMLSMFRLSQYVRSILVPSESVDIAPPVATPDTQPGDVIQQGRLLLVALEELPEGVVPVPIEGPIELEGADGVYTIRAGKPPDGE
jgi:hypothetical protein